MKLCMSRKIYDFGCPSGHITEEFINDSVTQIDCPNCRQLSTRLVSYAGPMLDVVSGDFPGATMKWAKGRQKKIKAERRETELHGPAD